MPETFWHSTMTELVLAIEGLMEAKGIKKKKGAPSKMDMEALLAKYG